MRYAKLIDGRLKYSPKKITRDDTVIYNPLPETLLAEGYLPVREEPQPEPEEGYYLVPVYTQTEDEIVIGWREEVDPYYYDASPDEIAEALEGIL